MKVLSLPQKSALAFQHFTLQLVDSISQIVASFTCSNYLPAIYWFEPKDFTKKLEMFLYK